MRGVRGGPTLTTIFLVDEGEETMSGPPSGRCRTNIECWLRTFVAFLIFQGSGPELLWKPYLFQGGGGGGGSRPPVSSLYPPMALFNC